MAEVGDQDRKLKNLDYEKELALKQAMDYKRLHECHICKRGFKKLNDMKRHVASVHEGRKDFTCNVCYKAFTRKADLNKHIARLHETRTRPY